MPLLAAVVLPAAMASGLVVLRASTPVARAPAPAMGFFDQLSAAFENDDTLGERESAGLKKKAEFQTVTFRGPKPQNPFQQQPVTEVSAIAGQKLHQVAQEAGIPIRYSCMNGSCRICDVSVNGQRVPSCITDVPKNDLTVDYGIKPGDRAEGRVAPTKKAAPRAGARAAPAQQERPKLDLEARLRAETEKKAAAKKGGGWPFG